MSNGILVNPLVSINGESFSIVPNSLSLKVGIGTKAVKTEAAGTTLNVVVSDNLEDAIGSVTFSMMSDLDNFNNIQAVRNNEGNNIVEVTIQGSGASSSDSLLLTSSNSSVTTEIDFNFKSEGQFEVTMEGSQFV